MTTRQEPERLTTLRRAAPAPACASGCDDERPSTAPEARDIMRFRSGTLHEHWYVAALSRQLKAGKPYASTIMEEARSLNPKSDKFSMARDVLNAFPRKPSRS